MYGVMNQCTSITKCKICPLARQSRLPYPIRNTRHSEVFDLIHVDLWVPYKHTTYDDKQFFLTIVYDHSRFCWVYLMRHKSDVFLYLKQFFTLVKPQFEKIIKKIRSANGIEFINDNYHTFVKLMGVIHQRSCVGTPQQNEIVERKHKHLLEVA